MSTEGIRETRETRKTKKAIIIGAGPAGLWAARTLKQNGIEPVLIEKNDHVGGKCSTFSDPLNPSLKTERGAGVLTPNYGSVIDALSEKHISLENKIHTNADALPLYDTIKHASLFTKIKMGISLVGQVTKFLRDVQRYNHVRDNLLPMPEDFTLSFKDYAEKHHLNLLSELLKPIVTAFGYGAMEECRADAVMQYMGIGTLLYLMLDQIFPNSSLLGIHNGFQYLMEKVAEDFDVLYQSDVIDIKRNADGVKVTYRNSQGEIKEEIGDTLVLAIAPSHWARLGLDMTAIEKECADQLQYHQYPIAVCEIEGKQAEIFYTKEGVAEAGYGQLSLITSRDNRQNTSDTNGRLCTAYINLPNGVPFTFTEENKQQLKDEILALPGVTNVKFLEFKVWDDYMPTLPWDTRLALEKEQMRPDTNTLYVGAYPLGGFEDVACVTAQAEKAVNKYIINQNNTNKHSLSQSLGNFFSEVSRAITYYSLPKENPVNDENSQAVSYRMA